MMTVRDVKLAFGGQTVLDGVDLDVHAREVLGLVGPNGSGKTSLCNVISGLYQPSGGSVRLDGRELVGLPSHLIAGHGVSRTFQGAEVLPGLTVLENVLVGRERRWRAGFWSILARTASSARESRRHSEACRAALAAVGLSSMADSVASDLPFALRKLVELARCIAMDPRVLMLDEPTSGMTALEKQDVTEIIRRLAAETDLAIILIEHDVYMVRSLARRTAVLNFGKKIADAATSEVFEDKLVREVYIGDAVPEERHAQQQPLIA
jgi:branched-chain amino acid transport system ATP-binding protein